MTLFNEVPIYNSANYKPYITKYMILSRSKVALPCPIFISQLPIERKAETRQIT